MIGGYFNLGLASYLILHEFKLGHKAVHGPNVIFVQTDL
jgi:hypothetical protein